MHASTKIVWRDSERPKETKETLETVETSEDTYKYKIVWRDREKPKETKEDCRGYWRYMQAQKLYGQRPKETKETAESVEIRANTKLYGETETKGDQRHQGDCRD